jgi:hypothetical protein
VTTVSVSGSGSSLATVLSVPHSFQNHWKAGVVSTGEVGRPLRIPWDLLGCPSLPRLSLRVGSGSRPCSGLNGNGVSVLR